LQQNRKVTAGIIDSVRMRSPNGLSRRDCFAFGLAAAACGCAPMHGEEPTRAGQTPGTLNALAKEKGLMFGSCLGTGPSGAPRSGSLDGKRANSFEDPNIRALVIEQCGMIVPENELKWYALRKSPKEFDFRRSDILVDFAHRNGLAVRGHTLLWNNAQWFPPWVADYDFGANPRAEAERLLRQHITTVCARYDRRIFAWDVVNETIDHDTGEMRDTVFSRHLGPEVIDIAFGAARAAAPQAQLVYNDYMSWGSGNARHRAGVLRLLERLKKNGVPVDALGVQSHIGPGATEAGPSFSAGDQAEWRRFIDEAVGMGLDIVITEFDVGDQTMPADIAMRDREVAALARDYFDLMLSYPQLRYAMAWCLVDRYSWLQERWPRADGLPKRPCPYDDLYQPKPLRAAIADAFRTAPARPPMAIA
jgi:endo-1,4-beta-xylanase